MHGLKSSRQSKYTSVDIGDAVLQADRWGMREPLEGVDTDTDVQAACWSHLSGIKAFRDQRGQDVFSTAHSAWPEEGVCHLVPVIAGHVYKGDLQLRRSVL